MLLVGVGLAEDRIGARRENLGDLLLRRTCCEVLLEEEEEEVEVEGAGTLVVEDAVAGVS